MTERTLKELVDRCVPSMGLHIDALALNPTPALSYLASRELDTVRVIVGEKAFEHYAHIYDGCCPTEYNVRSK